MARLSTRARKALPRSDFALRSRRGKTPTGRKGNKAGRGAFPINDKAHARAALRLAPYSYKKGNISKAQEKKVIRKADRKLGKKGR